MNNYRITIQDKKSFKIALEFLQEVAILGPDGNVGRPSSFQLTVATQIVYSLVSVAPQIPDVIKTRAINLALNRVHKDCGPQDIEGLLNYFVEKMEESMNFFEGQKSEYVVLTFLNVENQQFKSFEPFSVLGTDFKFLDWAEIQHLELSNFWNEIHKQFALSNQKPAIFSKYDPAVQEGESKYQIDTQSFSPIVAEIKTFPGAAVSVISERLDLLRSLLNLNKSVGLSMWFQNHPQPIAKIFPPPVYGVFSKNGALVNSAYNLEQYRYSIHKINEKTILGAKEFIGRFESASIGSSSNALMRFLYMYQQALDFTDVESQFLSLWQLLEAMVFNEPGQKTQVPNRIATLLKLEKYPVLGHGLKVLEKTRNQLVHTGYFPEGGNQHIFSLKKFVDLSLLLLIELSDSLSAEEELKTYFQFASVNKRDIEKVRKVIDFIEERRS